MAEQIYTYAEIEDGFTGFIDLLTRSSRVCLTGLAYWAGFITGTEAVMAAGGGGSNPFRVYVDGVDSTPTVSSNMITLFSGLADEKHFVYITSESIYQVANNYIYTSGYDILTVTGESPDLTTLSGSITTNPSFSGINTQPTITSPYNSNVTPTYNIASSNTAAVGQIIVKAQADTLYIHTYEESLYYSVDRGTPINVTGTKPSSSNILISIEGLDGTTEHEYTIWAGTHASSDGISLIMASLAGETATFLPIDEKITVYQFGDSITYGNGATPGEVDVWLYGLANNYAVAKMGVSGQVISELTTEIPDYFAEIEIPDYVLNAIGRNDNQTLDQYSIDYDACLDAFLVEGCTNIICRGQLPGTVSDDAAISETKTRIEDVIASIGDSNIVFMDTTDWTTCATIDGVHPTAAGYVTIAADESPALSALISTTEEIVLADTALSSLITFDMAITENNITLIDSVLGVLDSSDLVITDTAVETIILSNIILSQMLSSNMSVSDPTAKLILFVGAVEFILDGLESITPVSGEMVQYSHGAYIQLDHNFVEETGDTPYIGYVTASGTRGSIEAAFSDGYIEATIPDGVTFPQGSCTMNAYITGTRNGLPISIHSKPISVTVYNGVFDD